MKLKVTWSYTSVNISLLQIRLYQQKKEQEIPQICWKLPHFVEQRSFEIIFCFFSSSVTLNIFVDCGLWTLPEDVTFGFGKHLTF